MYAQTVAYGLLSARLSDPTANTLDHLAEHLRTSPFLKELLDSFLHTEPRGEPGAESLDFDELGLNDIISLLDSANLEAVVRDFGDRNPLEDPVIHFYEHFLREYDAKKRMRRGVFYTPRPVVNNIVRAAHRFLIEELGLEDGLADTTSWRELTDRISEIEIPAGVDPGLPFVQILDPATGTGTFLVEVVDLIHEHLSAKWTSAGHTTRETVRLWNEYVPSHLLPRLYGYELLMAPYAIAHLKVSLKLYETGYAFESDERAQIYLTNSLEPSVAREDELPAVLPALAHEAAAVNRIKRNNRYTVIVGNPPYSDASQNLGPKFTRLIDPFRFYRGNRIRERGAIRFEHAINNDYVKFWGLIRAVLQESPVGVACLITSNSFVGGKSFRGLRDALVNAVSRVRVIDLHGEGWVGGLAHGGVVDENVFEIQTGVAITRLTKTPGTSAPATVEYGELVGTLAAKSSMLLKQPNPVRCEPVELDERSYSSYVPRQGAGNEEYWDFPQLDSLFLQSIDGIKTSRDGLVIGNEPSDCLEKIQRFAEFKSMTSEEVEREFHFKVGRFDTAAARRHIATTFEPNKMHPFAYRPFDHRSIYYDRALILSHRMNFMPVILAQGAEGIACASRLSSKGFSHAVGVRTLCSNKFSSHDINSRMFPSVIGSSDLLGTELRSNINSETLDRAGFREGLNEVDRARMYGRYVLAVLNAPSFQARYVEEIQQDFPRIPQPGSTVLLEGLAEVGAGLMDAQTLSLPLPDKAFPLVGHIGGIVARPRYEGGTLWITRSTYVSDVPAAVWEYRIAGYSVCRSWFSAGNKSGLARTGSVLTRGLLHDLRSMLRGVSATIALQEQADALIEAHGGWPQAFR